MNAVVAVAIVVVAADAPIDVADSQSAGFDAKSAHSAASSDFAKSM